MLQCSSLGRRRLGRGLQLAGRILALDLGKRAFSAYWVQAETGEIGSRKMTRSKFEEWMRTREPSRVVLEAGGSSLERLVKPTVFLSDMRNFEPMNAVYDTFFPEPRPARSYFGATGFRRKGQLLQIDCIAYVD